MILVFFWYLVFDFGIFFVLYLIFWIHFFIFCIFIFLYINLFTVCFILLFYTSFWIHFNLLLIALTLLVRLAARVRAVQSGAIANNNKIHSFFHRLSPDIAGPTIQNFQNLSWLYQLRFWLAILAFDAIHQVI